MIGKAIKIKNKSHETDFHYLFECDEVVCGKVINPKIMILSLEELGRCIAQITLHGAFTEKLLEDKICELMKTYEGEDLYLNTSAPKLKI